MSGSWIYIPAGGSKRLADLLAQTGLERLLIVKHPWLDMILKEGKRLELRAFPCHFRCLIGLGSRGILRGTAHVVDCFEIDDEWKQQNVHLHMVKNDPGFLAQFRYAWLLADVKEINPPIPFSHPSGAQVWVKLRKGETEEAFDNNNASSTCSGKQSQPLEVNKDSVHVLRTSSFAVDKFFNGLPGVCLAEDALPDETTELYVGSVTPDLVYGSVTLGPRTPLTKEKCDQGFNVPIQGQKPTFYRPILKASPFPRTVGTARTCKPRLVHFIEKNDLKDLKRNPNNNPLHDLPEPDLTKVAESFVGSLSVQLLERLRVIAGALNGSTIRLATTCSGVDSGPSIFRAVFRRVW